MQKTKGKARLQQPSSSFADVEILRDENVGKDFGILINAPLSKGGHFVFKSEKTWSLDSSQYSEFFILNLQTLSAAIDCIPFNEYIDVDNKYFTSDQLTSIHNNSEKGKTVYNAILNNLNASSSSSAVCSKNEINENTNTNQLENLKLVTSTKSQSKNSIDDLEEDIEFLLSLKEPVQSNLRTITQPISISHSNDSKATSKNVSTKPIDLEKWLDSVLDD